MDKAFKKYLQERIRHRNRFLNRHPELKPYEQEIDSVIKIAGSNPISRAIALNELINKYLKKRSIPSLKVFIDKLKEAKLKNEKELMLKYFKCQIIDF